MFYSYLHYNIHSKGEVGEGEDEDNGCVDSMPFTTILSENISNAINPLNSL